MKKAVTFLLNVILFGALLLFAGSICTAPIVGHTITQEITGNVESQRMLDVVMDAFPEASADQLFQVQEALKNSSAMEEITTKYIDEIAAAAASGETLELPEITEDMNTLIEENVSVIEENLGKEFTQEQKQTISKKLEEKSGEIQNAFNTVTQSMLYGASGEKAVILKAYHVITSTAFQACCGIVVLILFAGICFQKKSPMRAMAGVGITFLLAGICLAALIPSVASEIGGEIADRMLGRYMSFDFSSVRIAGSVMLGMGVVMELTYLLAGRRR